MTHDHLGKADADRKREELERKRKMEELAEKKRKHAEDKERTRAAFFEDEAGVVRDSASESEEHAEVIEKSGEEDLDAPASGLSELEELVQKVISFYCTDINFFSGS